MTNPDFSTYEYACGYVTLKPEGYFYVQLKENSHSTIETVADSHRIMAELVPQGPVYIIADVGVGSSSDEDIFDYIAQSEFGARVKAEAIIVHELAARLMGNLFLRFIKKRREIRIFSKYEDAGKWLQDQMKKSEKNGSNAAKMILV